MIAQKWDEMIHKSKSVVNLMPVKIPQTQKGTTTFNICTDIVQSDTGVNRSVTDKKYI